MRFNAMTDASLTSVCVRPEGAMADTATATAAARSGTAAAERDRRRTWASLIRVPSCRFDPSGSITQSSDMHDRMD